MFGPCFSSPIAAGDMESLNKERRTHSAEDHVGTDTGRSALLNYIDFENPTFDYYIFSKIY